MRRDGSFIGRKACLAVAKSIRRFATAHELRRSFGTRWTKQVKPATLQVLMRHADFSTMMEYYVELDADDVADDLWRGHKPELSDLGETSVDTMANGSA